jgi:hypothetical protein
MRTRRRKGVPEVTPIVPVLHDRPFDDPMYLFEPKYDGFRGMLYLTDREASAPSAASSWAGLTSWHTGSVRSSAAQKPSWTAKWWRSTRRAGRTSASSWRPAATCTTPRLMRSGSMGRISGTCRSPAVSGRLWALSGDHDPRVSGVLD